MLLFNCQLDLLVAPAHCLYFKQRNLSQRVNYGLDVSDLTLLTVLMTSPLKHGREILVLSLVRSLYVEFYIQDL